MKSIESKLTNLREKTFAFIKNSSDSSITFKTAQLTSQKLFYNITFQSIRRKLEIKLN